MRALLGYLLSDKVTPLRERHLSSPFGRWCAIGHLFFFVPLKAQVPRNPRSSGSSRQLPCQVHHLRFVPRSRYVVPVPPVVDDYVFLHLIQKIEHLPDAS